MIFEPLKGRKGRDVSGLENIFKKGRHPCIVRTDKGAELNNSNAKKLLTRHNIKYFTTQNDNIKANFAERIIKTIKNRLFQRRMIYVFMAVLQQLVSIKRHTDH